MKSTTSVAFADGDALELVVARGSGNVLIRRSVIAEGQASLVGIIDVGVGADSIVLAPDGTRAYVYNAFDDTVHAFDVPQLHKATSKGCDPVESSLHPRRQASHVRRALAPAPERHQQLDA